MNKKVKERLVDYQEKLIQKLQDPEHAVGYLNVALADEDPRMFLLALKNVVEAHGEEFATIAKKSDLNRENLYRMLSKKGNPRLTSIVSLLNSIGFHLSVGFHKIKGRAKVSNDPKIQKAHEKVIKKYDSVFAKLAKK
jgi:probable addiction module antidote protein